MEVKNNTAPGVEEQTMAQIIRQALDEDIGSGDITAESIIPVSYAAEAAVVAKADGVVGGLEVMRRTFEMADPGIRYIPIAVDGAKIRSGSVIARLSGPARSIVTAERTALNFLQRMSGIASMTALFVEKTAGTRAKILDTRKTAPGLRLLDKWAVRLGGGQNHRSGLYDMVLIKENHIRIAGSIGEAVTRARSRPAHAPVEIEVRDLGELAEAARYAPDRILLDNFDVETLQKAVALIAHTIPLEASGNITLDTVGEIAQTGVDYISVGALTHSVRALDVSLLLH
jgi:nicotinate-nucleotide pyrophosphorylase (carboxylating)